MRNPAHSDLLPVHEALAVVLAHPAQLPTEECPLSEARGRVLAEDLCADRPFPPFDRVTMDGIAIRFADFSAGIRNFINKGTQAAGQPPLVLESEGACLEIMTGAVLPAGADTIIRYEDLRFEGDQVAVLTEEIEYGQNLHREGSDRRMGDVIVPSGQLLAAGEIGVAATVGKNSLRVRKMPRVAVISTGDELVSVESVPLPHQIRSSNMYALSAALQQMGVPTERLHFPDDPDVMRTGLNKCLRTFDAIILSGGVSEGAFDFIPGVLAELQVEKLFHRVQQRPGKPFWFGTWQQQCAIFALPGNPVSAFLGIQKYFKAWLHQSLGLPPLRPSFAMLAEDYTFKPNLTYFLQVKLESTPDGLLRAYPRTGGGSGDLANLSDADGFLELPADETHFRSGTVFPVLIYR
ncbi:MAG: molybdopterin molybdotransferase MoeA [Haliscomenobacter sp.]